MQGDHVSGGAKRGVGNSDFVSRGQKEVLTLIGFPENRFLEYYLKI